MRLLCFYSRIITRPGAGSSTHFSFAAVNLIRFNRGEKKISLPLGFVGGRIFIFLKEYERSKMALSHQRFNQWDL